MKKVLHVTRGYLAGAPKNLSRALNEYRTGKYISTWIPTSLQQDDLITYNYRVSEADIIHWHNHIDHTIIHGTRNHKKHIIHYHSEPGNTDIIDPEAVRSKLAYVKQLVVCHYHAGLSEYKKCQPVKNVVWVPADAIEPEPELYSTGKTNRLRIGFSPTSNDFLIWQKKGTREIYHCINDILRPRFTKRGIAIELVLIQNKSYSECIHKKSTCDIILDECVTPSYHMSSLEGLALGKLTVCWVDSKVEEILKNITGSDINPFHGTYIGWLADYLEEIILKGPGYIKQEGLKAKKWFDKYWNVSKVVSEYDSIYSSL